MAASFRISFKFTLGQITALLYRKERALSSALSIKRLKYSLCSDTVTRKVINYGQPSPHSHPHLLKDNEVTPGITKQEYKYRRIQFMKQLVAATCQTGARDHLVIIPAAQTLHMTVNVPYPYRQNTEFLYLTGFKEPNSILVMFTNSKHKSQEFREAIFLRKKDHNAELWEGERTGRDGAIDLLGIEEAYEMEQFEPFLEQFINSENLKKFVLWFDVNSGSQLKAVTDFIQAGMHLIVDPPKRHNHNLRLIKSSSEIKLLKESNQVTSEAFRETMKFTKAGVCERHLQSKMEFECCLRGADYLAYIPVVAGGNRACTIHYIRNNQILYDGDLVLMDAGAEFHGYCSDVTRTWPVSGRFSAPQRQLYDAVIHVHEKCLRLCRPGSTLNKIHTSMILYLQEELIKLGVIDKDLPASSKDNLTREICPHYVGHYFGMDIHDSSLVSRNHVLQPGMTLAIEPGLYIQEDRVDLPEKYRGIGIRVEDNILITQDGYINLTENCPKCPDEIELLMQR